MLGRPCHGCAYKGQMMKRKVSYRLTWGRQQFKELIIAGIEEVSWESINCTKSVEITKRLNNDMEDARNKEFSPQYSLLKSEDIVIHTSRMISTLIGLPSSAKRPRPIPPLPTLQALSRNCPSPSPFPTILSFSPSLSSLDDAPVLQISPSWSLSPEKPLREAFWFFSWHANGTPSSPFRTGDWQPNPFGCVAIQDSSTSPVRLPESTTWIFTELFLSITRPLSNPSLSLADSFLFGSSFKPSSSSIFALKLASCFLSWLQLYLGSAKRFQNPAFNSS